jgi:hypothetical protein
MPYQLLGVQLHTMAMSGLSRVRTELFRLLVIPSVAPHPVQPNRKSTSHGDLGNLSSSPQCQVEKLAALCWVTANRNLGCLHQQETQQRVALFGDVSQASPIPARLLRRYQSQIARDLLTALEPLRPSDD